MNQDINPIELVIKDISPSQVPAIVLPVNPSIDAVSAGLSIYFGLGKQGKQAMIACPTPVTYNVPGVEHIKTTFTGGGRNLVISFPYTDGSVDKVDYRIENNTFNLIVIPREGFDKITPEQINYSYQGGTPDTFITVGAGNLQSLGKLYNENKQILDTLPLVTVNRQKPAASFGSSEFIRENAFLTEIALELLSSLEIQIDQNIATIAFAGISLATNNFTGENTSAEVFELAGRLIRMGAKKTVKRPLGQQAGAAPQSQTTANEPQRKWIDRAKNTQGQKTHNQQKQTNTKMSVNKSFQNPQKPVRPERFTNTQNQPDSVAENESYESENYDKESTYEDVQERNSSSSVNNDTQHPTNDIPTQNEDWLKPKIFKGGGFI